MATTKSYTDLDQSKKLAKILQTESADMFCADVFNKEEETHSYNFHILSTWGCNTFEELKDRENKFVRFIPCWSIAALMKIIEIDKSEICFDCYGEKYRVNVHYQTLGSFCQDNELYESKIDALFAMIIKLHKRNLL